MLDLCTHMLKDGRVRAADRRRAGRQILDENVRMAGAGLRVLAVAYRPCRPATARAGRWPSSTTDGRGALERGLVFLGLVGMIDPPRPEVKRAVRGRRAGRASAR